MAEEHESPDVAKGGTEGKDAVPKNGIMVSPLFTLVVLMAYIAECGGRDVPIEKKAVFLAILRKHVNRDEISEQDIHVMMHDAFKHTLQVEYRSYLESVKSTLTMGQRYAIIANLYHMMMVDGEIRDGEEGRIDLCRREFDLDPVATRQIRRVSLLRNDTSIFLDPNHPCNDPAFFFHPGHS